MSYWEQPYHEEGQAFDAWKSVRKIPESQTYFDTMKGLNFNDKQSLDYKLNSDCNIWDTNPICNQLLMQNKMDEHRNEDYKISSSIKTLWNDASQSKPNTYTNQIVISRNGAAEQIKSYKQTPQSEYVKHMTPLSTVILEQSVKKMSTDNATAVANNYNGKGRAITARNVSQSSYIPQLGIENGNIHQACSPSPVSSNQRETMLSANIFPKTPDNVLSTLKLIVKNGFLDSKILHEPISPDTYDLLHMLIFYVMEYSKTRNYATSCDNNPALCADINNISYKINLIRNEIVKCQSQFIEQRRVQYEIWQSFAALSKKPMFNSPTSVFNQYEVPMINEANTRRNQIANRIESASLKTCSDVFDSQNQRFTQRQFDQFPQQENANNTSGKITFLAKAKNVENCFFYDQTNNEYLRKDTRLFGNPNSTIN